MDQWDGNTSTQCTVPIGGKERAIRTHSNGSGKNEQNNGGLHLFSFLVLYIFALVCVHIHVRAYFVSSRARTTQAKKNRKNTYTPYCISRSLERREKNTNEAEKKHRMRQKRKRTYSKLIYILWMRCDSKIKYTEIQIELSSVWRTLLASTFRL